MNNRFLRLLLLEHSGQVQHHQNGKTEKVADRFDQLQVSEFREKVDRNQTHREPPYKKIGAKRSQSERKSNTLQPLKF